MTESNTSTTEPIDIGQMVLDLEAVIAEAGDPGPAEHRSDARCIYAQLVVHPESERTGMRTVEVKPVCIVGQWLHRHGVDLEPLARSVVWNQKGFAHWSDAEARYLGVPPEISDVVHSAPALTERAKALLADVQDRQDQGDSWREALRQAKAHAGVTPEDMARARWPHWAAQRPALKGEEDQ
jgi:hypothetical protein